MEKLKVNTDKVKNSDYQFILNLSSTGMYRITITASSEQSELAQLPVTLFSGAIRTFTRKICLRSEDLGQCQHALTYHIIRIVKIISI